MIENGPKNIKTFFENFKVLIATDTKLSYSYPEQETWIQCNDSSYGLRGVLLQSGKPVYYACKSLTAAEQNYS